MSDKERQEWMEELKAEIKKKLEKLLTKEDALRRLVGAGILDWDGNFTEPYYDLCMI